MIDKRVSYTAADVIPVKIFLIDGLVESIRKGYIPPVHISLCPTNKCNQDCEFCSYSARDRNIEMNCGLATNIVDRFQKLGTKAVDLTGGGEPLMYPFVNVLVEYLLHTGMRISLTTNGLLLHKIADYEKKFTWIRVSFSDYSDWNWKDYLPCHLINRTDWNFSYVATRKPNYELFANLVKLANEFENVTHVRVVSDLLDLEYLPPIEYYAKYLKQKGIDDSKVIYQDRQRYEHGIKKCLISLLRPNIDARGDVYPCCGTQYAIADNPARDFAPMFSMGRDYRDIWINQRFFDGSRCTKCYYYGYNELLNVLQNPEVKHIEFV